MVKNHIILAVAWMVFCVLHSVLASGRVKRTSQKLLGKYFPRYRLFYVLFAFAVFTCIVVLQAFLHTTEVFRATWLSRTGGIVAGITGSIIMVISIRKYFPRLSGIWKNDEGTELFQCGLNRYVRHPLYLGTFCFIWGWFLVVPYWSLLVSNVVITCYTLIGIHFEEKKLAEIFGENYALYKKQVPKILPRVK